MIDSDAYVVVVERTWHNGTEVVSVRARNDREARHHAYERVFGYDDDGSGHSSEAKRTIVIRGEVTQSI